MTSEFRNCVARSLALPVTAALAAATSTWAAPPTATVSVAVNGEKPLISATLGVEIAGGNVAYTGLAVHPLGLWTVTWNATADLNPTDASNPFVTCVVTATNASLLPADYSIDFSVPLMEAITTGSTYGGSLVVKLKCNANGGSLTCDERGSSIWSGNFDDQPFEKQFYCPFSMTATGLSTLSTNADFGLPIPSATGPRSLSKIGSSINCTLTPGEKLTLTSLMVAKAGKAERPRKPESCVADVNGDGIIDAEDLGLILAYWDSPGANDEGLKPDVNEDGVVDSGDLGIVLGYWGQCLESDREG